MPITRTETITLYQFDELSDRAKEKARDWFRPHVFDSSSDWDHIYDDAKEIGKLIGIEIDKIYFSGFSSQGDGACFKGSYSYAKGGLKALQGYIGSESKGDKELLRIAKALQEIQRKNFYKISASMSHRGHYYHSGCMSVSVDGFQSFLFDSDIDSVIQLMRDYADWIYSRLEDEYEYQTSDEVIDETIRANEYTFDEDGNRED